MSFTNPPAKQREATATFSTSSGGAGDAGAISAQLNDFARAYAQVYPGATSGTAEIPYGEIASLLGQMQQNSIKQANSKFKATIKADKSSVSFEGFEIEPNLQISPGSFAPQVHAVHNTASLQRLNMAMYGHGFSDLTEIKDADIIQRIITIMKRMVEHWRTKVWPDMTKEDQKYTLSIHEMNMEPLKILYSILQASGSFEISGLAQLAETLESVNTDVNNWLLSYMVSDTDNFWSAFLEMTGKLGLLYAPAFGGSSANGKLFSPRMAFAAETGKDDLDGIVFQPSLRLSETPITYVIMPKLPFTSLNRSYTSNATLLPGQAPLGSLKYPEGQVTGRAHVVAQPPFLNLAGMNYNRDVTWGESTEINRANTNAAKLSDGHVKQINALRKFLTGYLRNTLHRLQLQGSSVSISTALGDMDWELGRAYSIKHGGKPLFRGILASCVHSVGSSQERPMAMTSLGFSYVQWGGFHLSFA